MSTATWSAARGDGSVWCSSVVCPHATSTATTYLLPINVTPAQVEAASSPTKLYTFHVAKTGCDCTLVVETPVP